MGWHGLEFVRGDYTDDGPEWDFDVNTSMVDEYARHNGHADLIRESIDGRTGE